MKRANGAGGTSKLSGKRRNPFFAFITNNWDDQGKQKKEIIEWDGRKYWETRQLAERALIMYLNDPYDFNNLDITLTGVFDHFKKMKLREDIVSIGNYNAAYNESSKLHNKRFIDIRTSDIQDIIDNMINKSYTSKNYVKIMFNQLFEIAKQKELPIKMNYAEFVILGKKELSSKHKPFSKLEKEILWKNLKQDYVDTVIILIYTGLRPSELLNVKLDKINLNKRYLIAGSKTKAGINRIIPIHKRIIPLIENRITISEDNKSEYLIWNDSKRAMNYRYYLDKYKELMIKLDLDHTPHDGRHTCSTDLDSKGANRLARKLILGHSVSGDITDGIYNSKTKEQLIATIDLLD
ncbi:MAG: site-specific integrase [Bacilli bacterium]|nr:site-specific integrase [Bacilli bacterium]MDD4794948.1 site-specific integrase [Bacilli bacterium]